MPIVVSDTSPIRALHHLGQLQILQKLFDSVLITPAVQSELLTPRKRFTPISISLIPAALVRQPSNLGRVRELNQSLDLGESESIALAEEIGAQLLIDERSGREVAKSLGIKLTGVVGVLVEARQQGHITAVLPLLRRLQNELGFFLHDSLFDHVRTITGEV